MLPEVRVLGKLSPVIVGLQKVLRGSNFDPEEVATALDEVRSFGDMSLEDALGELAKRDIMIAAGRVKRLQPCPLCDWCLYPVANPIPGQNQFSCRCSIRVSMKTADAVAATGFASFHTSHDARSITESEKKIHRDHLRECIGHLYVQSAPVAKSVVPP